MTARQREEDQRCLRAVCDALVDEDNAADAMEDMLGRLTSRQVVLTAKQRAFVNSVASRVGVEPAEGPEEDGAPEGARFTQGPPPRGKDVLSLVGALSKRPPGR